MVHTRPYITCIVFFLAQIVHVCDKNVLILVTILPYLKISCDSFLRIRPLHNSTLRIVVFTDSRYAKNSDETSQLGYFIVLADARDACNVIHYTY